MNASLNLTAVYEPADNGWVQGRIAELPAVITAAPTIEEAKEMLRDALAEYLASLRSAPDEVSADADREELELTIGSRTSSPA
jgi:predicted RNase H-like HicB family nuclease